MNKTKKILLERLIGQLEINNNEVINDELSLLIVDNFDLGICELLLDKKNCKENAIIIYKTL